MRSVRNRQMRSVLAVVIAHGIEPRDELGVASNVVGSSVSWARKLAQRTIARSRATNASDPNAHGVMTGKAHWTNAMLACAQRRFTSICFDAACSYVPLNV